MDRRLTEYYLHLEPKSLGDAEKIIQMEKRDLEILGKLMGKYLPHWWDWVASSSATNSTNSSGSTNLTNQTSNSGGTLKLKKFEF